jgi:hypothetical protein
MLSIAMLSAGLYGCWLKYHKSIALIAVIIGILYLLERVFWSYVTINFANSIQAHPLIKDYTVLTQAGFLKGLGALMGGLIGGFGFSTALTLLFFSLRNPFGIAGGVIVRSHGFVCHYFHGSCTSTALTTFPLSSHQN